VIDHNNFWSTTIFTLSDHNFYNSTISDLKLYHEKVRIDHFHRFYKYFYVNLMKLGGSLGNVPQKLKKKKLDIFRTVSPFSRVKFILIIQFAITNIHLYYFYVTAFSSFFLNPNPGPISPTSNGDLFCI
jgi:hypothetical protein